MKTNTKRSIVKAVAFIVGGAFISLVGLVFMNAGDPLVSLLANGVNSLGFLLSLGGIFYLVSLTFWSSEQRQSLLQEEMKELRQRAQSEPEKVEPAWDLGRAKLELYFNRNLSQIQAIFLVSVGVMIAGFFVILYGITQAFGFVPSHTATSSPVTPAVLGSVAGVITEFIGATFLFIYRSTVQQAASHIKTLERINSVGMAMKILDTISDDSKELRDKTKAEMVKMLLSEGSSLSTKDDTAS